MGVEVVHWNPKKPIIAGRMGRLLPFRRPVNNFGDLLGPLLVERIVSQRGLGPGPRNENRRLLTVGSILALAQDGDTIWGTGANGKSLDRAAHGAGSLDIRAVRGPLTKELLSSKGFTVTDVFGDPGLLVGVLWPREIFYQSSLRQSVLIVPNFHDWWQFARDPRAMNPRSNVWECIRKIANADFVAGSSLHGVVLAESFGIPARFIVSGTEPAFKYRDYLAGSGRPDYLPAATLDEALVLGGQEKPSIDVLRLLRSFPNDLWLA